MEIHHSLIIEILEPDAPFMNVDPDFTRKDSYTGMRITLYCALKYSTSILLQSHIPDR